jgi:hypothetical protein
LTAAQVEARRHFAKLEKDGESVKDMLEEVMLYTYVDKDNFLQEKVIAHPLDRHHFVLFVNPSMCLFLPRYPTSMLFPTAPAAV